MQTTLTRSQFLDRPLRADDLQTVGLMLSDWFRKRYRRNATLHLTTTLWGFPQKQGAALLQTVQETAAGQNVPLESAKLCSADFLVLESVPVQAGGEGGAEPEVIASRVGACLHLLQNGPFENLLCEVTLSLYHGGKSEPRARRITLSGVVRANRFVLKAVWPEPDNPSITNDYASRSWPSEAKFVGAIAAFQTGNHELPRWAEESLFTSPVSLFINKQWMWFMRPRPQTFPNVFGRVVLAGLFAVAFGEMDVALYHSANHFSSFGVVVPVFVLLMLCSTTGICAQICLSFLMTYAGAVAQTAQMMRTTEVKTLASPGLVYVPQPWENDPPGLWSDPAFRKLCQEVEDAGGEFFQEVALQPAAAFQGVIRLYVFPQNDTVFALSFCYGEADSQKRIFPAYPCFWVQTDLAGGERLMSENRAGGFCRGGMPKGVIWRGFRNVSQPGEMLQKHLRTLQKAEAQGRKRVPLVRETIVARLNAESGEYAALPRKNGFIRWADAFRVVFDLPRREYAEDA